ncbi:MAG: phenylacetate--CoA ligase [Clostridia bacterium]|nr:phenylacetate--CoA ligase [Clostridia bacterium]
MEKYWNAAAEKMSRDEIHELQSKKLKRTLERVYTNVPYYRAKMQQKGILPGDIKTIDDLEYLPFTTKQDLRETYPFGLFAVPMSEVVRIHASSGTTGKQTVVGYTAHDIEIWAECVARALTIAGADNTSMVQVSYGYGLFTGGMGAHYGSERIGASTVPTSSGNTKRQITLLKDFGATHLCCTPSYAIYLGETIRDMGLDISEFKLKGGLFGAEPWTEGMRAELERLLRLDAHDIYGLSEIMGPGVAVDCSQKSGLHVWEDHFVPEIIDPDTEKVLPAKSNGELVFSCLSKEAFPLIRYRTRDVSSLNYDECECGRTHVRMSKPCGRTDDMLIIRGVNVFPSQIEQVLMELGETSPHYMLIVDRDGQLDTLEVQVEISDSHFFDEVRKMESLAAKIRAALQSMLGIAAKVTLVEPKSIERSEGKAKRIIDKRNLY